jgi:hypothetical protein
MKRTIGTIATKTAGSWGIKVAIVAAAAIGGSSLVSSSVFASLTATAFNTTPQSVVSGTLSLTETNVATVGITGGLTTSILALAPGDSVNRYIDLTNNGTMDETNTTIQMTGVPTNNLDSDTVKGLQMGISECSTGWLANGTCSGTNTVALSNTPVATAKATAQAMTLQSVLSGRVAHLKLTLSLPTGSEVTINGVLPASTVQGLSIGLTWTFLENQRTATITNS